MDDWTQTGRDGGELGLPVTDGLPMAEGPGRYNVFQRGTINWDPDRGSRHYGEGGGMREERTRVKRQAVMLS